MDRVIGLVKKFDKIDVSKVIDGCHHNSLQTLIINLSILNLFWNDEPQVTLYLLDCY